MDDMIMVDTCIFIEYFRSKNKESTLLSQLTKQYRKICVSAVVVYEVLAGSTDENLPYWLKVFEKIHVFPFDDHLVHFARNIYRQLKHENNLIDLGDILIAATAVASELPLATYNKHHFQRISDLKLIEFS